MTSSAYRAAMAALSLLATSLPLPTRAAPPTDCDKCFALVRANGSLVRYRNVLANYRRSTGVYEIVFKYPVNKCFISIQSETLFTSATINRGSSGSDPANQSVRIYMIDYRGISAEGSFGIYVMC
ncbi:MAG: hypothetical protein U1E45_22145 [Geminicoccaceae bacterium]